jgi:flagellar hook protein FlgE
LTYGSSLSVVGNNVANVNTVGYKAHRAEFSDLLSTVERGVGIGRGVSLGGVTRLFLQEAPQTTGSATDLAFYTRAGQFSVDQSGNLVNPQGLVVQGMPVDEAGNLAGELGNIVLGDSVSLPAEATTSMSLTANLNAESTTPVDIAGDPIEFPGEDAPAEDWFAASNFSTTIKVYDSLGQGHELTVLFRKSDSDPLSWEFSVVADATEVGGEEPDLSEVGSGTLTFNDDGTLEDPDDLSIDLTGLANGAADLSIALSFDGSTQFASPSAVTSVQQDGSSTGALTGVAIDPQGIITGQFSNGGALALYQIALADFNNVEKLDAVGNSLFAQSSESGDALIGTPGGGGFGSILSSGLELSTVDITQEFVSLIGSQRGFQVSSRIVTVADQMYDEAANLKR